MSSIRACALPEEALLSKYARAGAYSDCFTADIAGPVSHAAYVEAFYRCWLFKLERFVLTWLVLKPSTDAQARDLASGAADNFAAWHVEARGANQLLVCDFLGQTRSWLMIDPARRLNLASDGQGDLQGHFGENLTVCCSTPASEIQLDL